MTVGVLGTGSVGQAIGTKLVELGFEVMMGSRSATSENAKAWATSVKGEGRIGTFADAALYGEVLVNCTRGQVSIDVLHSCGDNALVGKVLIDVSNPLDFSKGFPPFLSVCNTDSLAEQIQRTFPDTHVVKALNTMTAAIMVNPALVPGNHSVFVCGNDSHAKTTTIGILEQIGWQSVNIIDVGDITCARGLEMILPLWVRLYGAFQTPMFNFHIARQ